MWAAQFRSHNKLDGYKEYLCKSSVGVPALFRTRKEAREWIERNYGYIPKRPDLRAEPHGWMPVRPVRVTVSIQPQT